MRLSPLHFLSLQQKTERGTMPTPLQLFLLTSIITILISTHAAAAAAATPTPLSHLPPQPPPSSSLFAPILAQLGFRQLASAANSLSATATTPSYGGPATIFAPTDSSLLTCPSCSLPLLLQEHSLPGLYSYPFLLSLPFATKIQTLSPSPLCLTITSSKNRDLLFVNGVQVTKPDLYTDGKNVVVHGIQGFVAHLSPLSCLIERTTTLSFPPSPPVEKFHLMASMLDDAMLRLRITGFSILALALQMKRSELLELSSMTVFAVDDVGIFADGGGQSFVKNVRMHIVPDRRLAGKDLEGMAAGTVVETMEWGEGLVVTTAGGGGPLAPMRINYVKIPRPELVSNLKIVVHGLAFPFERVNRTEAVDLARIGRRGFDGAGSEVEGKGGVCEQVGPVTAKEPTVEVEEPREI